MNNAILPLPIGLTYILLMYIYGVVSSYLKLVVISGKLTINDNSIIDASC